MVDIYAFIAMNEAEKACAVGDGTYLGGRFENNTIIQLYGVGDFYVEVFFDPLINKITRFRPFKTVTLLEPYLKNINII
jgi:hypothetical protein